MKRVREGLLYFYMSLNGDRKGQVERKRLNVHKRKIYMEYCKVPVKVGGNGIQNK
jgi:hypothetical protein